MIEKIENSTQVCDKKCLTEEEIAEYQSTIKQSLELLGKKNLSVIIHSTSFPSKHCQDTGIGTINSDESKEFINFISRMGYNSIQLGPDGKTKSNDASPYIGTIFSTNPLFIDLIELTTPEWGEILSNQTLQNIIDNNPGKDKNRTAYSYIYFRQLDALKEAYDRFIQKSKDKKIKNINKIFSTFKSKNSEWLDKDALYDALSKKHDNDYWPVWNDELDKNLFSEEYKNTKAAKGRKKQIEKDYKYDIDFYKFCQFVANEQKEKTKKYTLDHNIKTMADIQVAFSDRDYWAYQSLFLPGYYLGCPPDYFSKDGQAWGFPVLDPEKIFNKNGSLGEAGKLLRDRFDKVFKENPGGARIDHAVGLVDPWVYKAGKSAKPEDGGRRLYSSPDEPTLLKYSRITIADLNRYKDIDDPDLKSNDPNEILPPENELRVKETSLENHEILEKYSQVIKIVLDSAKRHGIDKESIIFEDLGTITNPVQMVMEKLGLSGIRVTQFVDTDKPDHMYRGRNVGNRHWITTGTHDNMPLALNTAELYQKNQVEPHIQFLAEDLVPDNNYEARNNFAHNLRYSQEEFVKAKFVELFTSPADNVQIFFTDVFGIEEPYNIPGTSGSENWSLRLLSNFKESYGHQLNHNKGLNLPEVLKMAIEAKGYDFVDNVNHQNPELIKRLHYYSSKFKS